MKFSVIIPNFNNEKYLRDTIESAINSLPVEQGEIVFIDDCSTDGSYDIALKYKEIIEIHKNDCNLGQELTTNKGLNFAKGEYAVILHSDDLLHGNFFIDLSKLLDRFPSAVMAVGERDEINSKAEKIHTLAPFYDGSYLIPGKEQAKVFMYTGFLPCQVLFRKDKILSFGGAKKSYVVNLDGLLWFKAALLGDVVYTQNIVCSYRKHASSTTSLLNKQLFHMFEYFCTLKEMFRFAEENGCDFSHEYVGAFTRMSELSIRYSKEIYASGDKLLAKRYLLLAEAIDPLLKDSAIFKNVENLIKNDVVLKSSFSTRTISYSPPEGSLAI